MHTMYMSSVSWNSDVICTGRALESFETRLAALPQEAVGGSLFADMEVSIIFKFADLEVSIIFKFWQLPLILFNSIHCIHLEVSIDGGYP